MSKEAMKLALEALELNNDEWKSLADSGDSGFWIAEDQDHYQQTNKAITALQEELAKPDFWEGYVPEPVKQQAIDKMAENAKELGLDYEPAKSEREIRNATLDEIADKIGKMPFGDTAASFAVWIREQKT